jgi:hypothetical protein
MFTENLKQRAAPAARFFIATKTLRLKVALRKRLCGF